MYVNCLYVWVVCGYCYSDSVCVSVRTFAIVSQSGPAGTVAQKTH